MLCRKSLRLGVCMELQYMSSIFQVIFRMMRFPIFLLKIIAFMEELSTAPLMFRDIFAMAKNLSLSSIQRRLQ